MKEKEIRNLEEIRVSDDSRYVSGYALVFESESEDLGFIEKISRDAITEDTIKKSDIFAVINHDNSRGILARSRRGKGSLKLTIDERGLKYEFEAPKTNLGNELLELLRRGDINQSSFAFSIADGGDKWEKKDGKYYRTINKIDKLYDVSPVYTPAYSETSVSCRSFEEFKNLVEYYSGLENEIDSL